MKYPALFLCMFAFAVVAWAQDVSQLPPSEQRTAATASGQGMTVQGCLSGSEGDFVLTQDNTNAAYKLTGADDQLKPHIGHEITVTGQKLSPVAPPSPSSKEQSAGEKPSSSGPDAVTGHDHSQAAGPTANVTGSSTLKVSHVQMIANTCASAPKGTAGINRSGSVK